MRILRITAVLIVLFTISINAHSIENFGVEKVTQLFHEWDDAVCLDVDDDYAYVIDGDQGLKIVDISRPSLPMQVSELGLNITPYEIVKRGNKLFIAAGDDGLLIVGISNVTNPTLLSALDNTGSVRGLDVDGSNAYLAVGRDGFAVVDVSIPRNPEVSSELEIDGFAVNVTTPGTIGDENFAYIAARDYMVIVDVSNPEDPYVVSYYESHGEVRDITLDGSKAYIADLTGCELVDVSDRERPSRLDRLSLQGTIVSVDTEEDLAFLGGNSNSVHIVECTNDTLRRINGTRNEGGNLKDIKIINSNLFSAVGVSGLRINDVSDPGADNLSETGFYGSTADIVSLSKYGSFLYLNSYKYGLVVLDIEVPSSPIFVNWDKPSPFGAGEILILDSTLYVSREDDLYSADISDPIDPDWLGTLWSDCDYEIAYSDGYLYTNEDEKINVINIADPSDMRNVSSYRFEEDVRDIAAKGEYCYVANGSDGIKIMDVADPVDIVEINSINTLCRELAINGNRMAAGEYQSVVLYNINNPVSPSIIGSWELPDGISSVTNLDFSPGRVIVSTGESGFFILDITEPDDITTAGYFNTPGYCQEIETYGNWAFSADQTNFSVYNAADALPVGEFSEAVVNTYRLEPAYPNPFNSKINIPFLLDHPAKIRLDIINQSGRLIRSQSMRYSSGGSYVLQFNAENLPSGEYIFKLSDGNRIETGLVTLIK